MTKKDSAHLSREPASAKESLIQAGLKLFAERGYDGTTVQDIAKVADVNVSLVSYYFGGKEGLYQEGLRTFAENRIQISRLIFTPATSYEDFQNKIRLWIEEIFKSHIDEDYCTRIVHRDIMLGIPSTLKVFEETFLQGFYIIRDFIGQAQQRSILRSDMESQVITEVLFGAIMEIPKMDSVRKHFFKRSFKVEKDRIEIIDHIVRVYLDGLRYRTSKEGSST